MRVHVLVPTLIRRGGVPRTAIEETKGLRRLGHEAVCYSFTGRRGMWEIFEDTPIELYPNIPFPFLRQSLNCWIAWRIPHPIDADAVVCHDAATLPVGYGLKGKGRVRYVPYMHDIFGYAHPLALSSTFRHVFFRPVEARMEMEHLSKADLLIVNSSYMIQQLLEVHPTLDVDTKILHPSVHPPPPSKVEREDFVLVVTRIHRGKRLEFLLDVIAQMPDMRVVIAGTPTPHLPIIMRRIRDLNLTERVQIFSPVSERQLSQLYRRARVFVHANEESFGMPALEALAHGCPIVHPYPSGIWDLAEDGVHGFKVDQEDPQDFTERIGRLMDDERLAERMGRNGVRLAMKYSWEYHNKKLEAYLMELE